MNGILTKLHDLRVAREQIEAMMFDHPNEDQLHRMGKAAISEMGAWEARDHPAQARDLRGRGCVGNDACRSASLPIGRHIDGTGTPVTDGAMTRLADLKAEWQTRQEEFRRISDELA